MFTHYRWSSSRNLSANKQNTTDVPQNSPISTNIHLPLHQYPIFTTSGLIADPHNPLCKQTKCPPRSTNIHQYLPILNVRHDPPISTNIKICLATGFVNTCSCLKTMLLQLPMLLPIIRENIKINRRTSAHKIGPCKSWNVCQLGI